MANLSALMNTELTGASFDYAFLPAVGVAGGAVTSWRRDLWNVSSACIRRFSVTTKMSPADGHGAPWWLTNVYGPSTRADKQPFLQELRDGRASCPGPWMVCGDFNLIYMASDKNNGRLHRGLMRRFREVIDDLQLDEIHLSGRLFTWSNGRDHPTMERLDRAFATVEWLQLYQNHHLRCLSSDSSDHAPLLLVLNSEPWARPRFRFDAF
jgi:hypothetical protein